MPHFTTIHRTLTSKDPRIQARPPGEAEIESKFPLPDKDKELELGRMQNLVTDYYKAGDYTKALQASENLLQDTETHFGREHPATASAYNNGGLMHKLLGNFDQARKQYQQALSIYKAVVGTDHASYASALHNLGNLNRSQIHFDDSLKATDRLTLLEEALDYLEQAFTIRQAEMGHDHPHTIASRSSWGSALAAQILHYYKQTSTRQYVSLKPDQVTQVGWDAAEEHLRQALQTAVQNPRGPSIAAKAKRGKPKKNKLNDKMETLSAASAAQNLAVFLKARATTESPYNQEWLNESHTLYQDVLRVRSQLLNQDHPDLYATKHSLAELLEAMGDKETANAVRQEIVDTYDPPTEDDSEQVKVTKTTTTCADSSSKT